MALEIIRQSNFTAGEVDPKLHGRRDLKYYASGLALAKNIIVRPQGEIIRRPGLAYCGRVRRQLVEIAYDTITMTAPHGGATGDVRYDDGAYFKTTDVLSYDNPFVLLTMDLGVAKPIDVVRLNNYVARPALSGSPTAPDANYPWTSAVGGLSTVRDAIKVQYQDGAGWSDFGYPVDLGTLLRSRVISATPGQPVTARYWRLIKTGATDWGANVFWLDRLRLYAEGEDESSGRIWRFTFDNEDQQFQVIATAGIAEVYQQGVRTAAFALPYSSAQVPYVRRAQSLDTLLTFHEDIAPLRVTRQGSATNWDTRAASFANVPLFDYDGTNTGAVNEKQDINFKDYANGDTFNLTYESEQTATITYVTPGGAGVAATIQSALEGLASVGSGNVSVTYVSDLKYTVEFVNDLGGADVSNIAGQTVTSSTGIVYMTINTRGQQGGEAMFSSARGYPRSGCFYQSRLYLGGLKLRPQTILASRIGEYFNLNIKGAKSDAGIEVNLDTDTVTRIETMYPGRNLQVFTSSSEFYFPTEPIVPVPAVKQATRRGIKPATPVFDIDGSTVFVTGGGKTVANFSFSYDAQNYEAPPLSVQASHLVPDIVDIGFRKAASTSEPDLALCVRADGGAAMMSAMLSQDVLGFYNMVTDGEILAATGDANGGLYLLVRRHREDDTVVTFERLDAERMLDSSVLLTGVHARVDGLGHLTGREVRLLIDGGYAGTATVDAEGGVDLPFASVRSVEAGLWFEPRGRLLPPVLEDPRGGGSLHARVGTIEFDLGPTATLQAGLAGGHMWDVNLKREALLDAGVNENLYEGWARLAGVPGFSGTAQIEFTQAEPGPLSIRQIVGTIGS